MNDLDAIQEQLLDILTSHRGPQHRITRAALLAQLNERLGKTSDREMRAALEKLRRENPRGAWICAHLRGGYFLARNEQELEKHLASDERRARNLLKRVSLQRNAAGNQKGDSSVRYVARR